MSDNKSKKILVVDDEADILELLKYNLKKEGYHVKTVNNGVDALEVAKTFYPDLVLLDIMMTNQDGVETCRQLREIPELGDTFIVFLTARSEEYSEVAAFDIGADDYITKPIKPRALMSRISAMFRRGEVKSKDNTLISVGDLTIDKTSYTIDVKDKKIGRQPIKNKSDLKKRIRSVLCSLQHSVDRVKSFFKLPDTKYALT